MLSYLIHCQDCQKKKNVVNYYILETLEKQEEIDERLFFLLVTNIGIIQKEEKKRLEKWGGGRTRILQTGKQK